MFIFSRLEECCLHIFSFTAVTTKSDKIKIQGNDEYWLVIFVKISLFCKELPTTVHERLLIIDLCINLINDMLLLIFLSSFLVHSRPHKAAPSNIIFQNAFNVSVLNMRLFFNKPRTDIKD